MSSITNLSVQQLRQAANLKEKIGALEKELHQLVGASASTTVTAAPKKKSKMSAAGRDQIAAAQKARWAKFNGTKSAAKFVAKAAPAAKAPVKKSKMSAATKAKLSAKMKALWAARKAKKS